MLGGIIAGALGGGAQAVGQIADNAIQKQTRMDLSKFESDLQAERQAAAARLAQTVAREDQTYNTTGAGADEKLRYAERQGAQETESLIDRERKLTPVKVESAGAVADAQSAAQRRADAAFAADPEARKGVRARSLATHIESAGSSVQAELARMSINDKKEVQKLTAEYDDPKTTPERQAAIVKALTVRGVMKPGEFDTEKVITEREDPKTGDKVKTERTQRVAPATGRTAPAAPAGAPKPGDVVDGYRYMGGNPRDKANWAPASQSAAGTVK